MELLVFSPEQVGQSWAVAHQAHPADSSRSMREVCRNGHRKLYSALLSAPEMKPAPAPKTWKLWPLSRPNVHTPVTVQSKAPDCHLHPLRLRNPRPAIHKLPGFQRRRLKSASMAASSLQRACCVHMREKPLARAASHQQAFQRESLQKHLPAQLQSREPSRELYEKQQQRAAGGRFSTATNKASTLMAFPAPMMTS